MTAPHFFFAKETKMAQKPFIMDAGIKVGDWHFNQTADGDMQMSYAALANTSQRPFIVDQGFKIGTVAWFESGDDFKMTEDQTELGQMPFIADAGIKVGDWIMSQNADLSIGIGLNQSIMSNLASTTAISSGTVATQPLQDAGTYSYTIDGLDTLGFAAGIQPNKPDVVTISSDGTYVFTQTGDVVHRGEMSTAYVISSVATWTQVFEFGTNGTFNSEGCHFWSTDGLFFFQIVAIGAGNEVIIHKHSVNTAWDMTTYTGAFYSELRIPFADLTALGVADPSTLTRMKFSPDGGYLFLFSPTTGEIVSIRMNTPWGTTYYNNGSFSNVTSYINLGVGTYAWSDITFDATGRKCYLTATTGGISGDEWIVEYDLGTAFDVSTATFAVAFDVVDTFGEFLAEPLGIFFIDGKLYCGGYTHNGDTGYLTYIDLINALVADPTYTYTIAITDSNGTPVTSVDEGSTYTLTVSTDAPDGTSVWMTSQADNETEQMGDDAWIDWLMDGTQSSARTATVTGGVATIELSIVADETTEAGYEKFRFVVSSSEDGSQTSGDGAGATPWVTINDTSQTPALDASDYSWTVTTSLDAPNPVTYSPLASGAANYGVSNDYTNSSIHGQFVEGTSMTWTATTDAPDGIQVYYTFVSTYAGAYQSPDDPNWGDVTSPDGTSGWKTVSNGQISGTFNAVDDGYEEDGEMKQIWLMKQSGDYSNILAESQWVHIADAAAVWTAPTAGETFTGGEGVTGSGSPQGQWYTSTFTSTGNPQVRVRMNENVDTDLRKNISYVLDNLANGDTFRVNTTNMTVTGNITKTYLGSPGYYDYYFDVSVAPGATTYFYEFTVYA